MAAAPDCQDYEGVNRRQWCRYTMKTDVAATVTIDDKPHDCVIEDVSLAGVQVRFANTAPKGRWARLDPGLIGAIDGRCVWAGDNRMGIAFGLCDTSVDLVFHCLSRMPALAGAQTQPATATG
jgi:hypothetical protein